MPEQAELFEPTGPEVGRLALQHLTAADKAKRLADVAAARGWQAIERTHLIEAARHESEAEALAMLADFERLGGVCS